MQAVLYGPNGLPLNPQTPAIIDPTFNALRSSLKPVEYQFPGALMGHYKAAFKFSNAAAATNNQLLSVRWAPTNNAVMVLLKLRWTHCLLTTAFTTQQYVDVAVTSVRSWTVADTGGSSLIPSAASSNRTRSSMGNSQLYGSGQVLCGSSSITRGTEVVEGQQWAQHCADVNSNTVATGGTPLITSPKDLYVHLPGADHPPVYAAQEGFILTVPNALGAAGVCAWGFEFEWLEALAY